MKHPRVAISALALSASALVALVTHEGYTDHTIIPVKGDRPTNGFGGTFNEDGTPVKMGDTIDPVRALRRSAAHIQKDETGLKRCVTGDLSQPEYDLLVDAAYQYGVPRMCSSSIVKNINAGNYVAACQGYGDYRFVAKRDCSLPQNWGPKGCRGVWLRAQERVDKCMSYQ